MTTEFWLNDQFVSTDAPAGLLLLDFLRRDQRLTGTKEGCKEGDCGACAVLIGELDQSSDAGRVSYKPVTSCLVPLGEMQGRHVVSIEGVNMPGLSPVQQSMVDFGGTQCGYCTPGFIVSMTWYLMAEQGRPTLDGMQRAISGNLCRCTGYASINRVGEELIERFGPGGEWENVWAGGDRVQALVEAEMLPAYFTEMPERLGRIDAPDEVVDGNPVDFFVAGGTDLYVQQGEKIPDGSVKILNHVSGHFKNMRGIRAVDGELRVGALTTFEEFGADPHVQKLIPRIQQDLQLIASLHIRNRATLGGNIVNASPIGDMTNFLLALGSRLVLSNGTTERIVAMKDFFRAYKTLDKSADELVVEIVIPDAASDSSTRTNFEKLSKRTALDIATVCSGFRCRANADGVIEEVGISMGGVAAIPLFLCKTCDFLVGKTISPETLQAACSIAMSEATPIGDVRGSEDYKRLLVRQFMIAHFTECYPERVRFEEFAS
jgi:xanthine dehydrogenase small subunit